MIDQSPELIQKISDTLDVQAMVGFASHPNVLEQAGAAEADMIIAVTLADEVNMVACQVAHSLFNVPTKIARVRNQSYLAPIWSDLFSREHMPIDVIISPEIEVARAVARRLQVPGAFDMIPLADGKVRVIGVICCRQLPDPAHAAAPAHRPVPRPQPGSRRRSSATTSRSSPAATTRCCPATRSISSPTPAT